MSFLRTIVGRLPKGFIRYVGRLQFRFPVLAPLLRKIGAQLASGEGIIQSGMGKGLKIDATGGYAGYLLGTTEPLEQEVLGRYLKPGHVFCDIGANVGFYTVIGAHLSGPSGHVYAFEPFPEAVAAIRKNVGLNAFNNVTVEEAAVSHVNGTTRFAIQGQSAENRIVANAEKSGPVSGDTPTIEVRLVTIDSYQKDTNARLPDVVMVDVEGAEIDVLRGMKNTLEQSRPVILCEVHWLGEKMTAYFDDVLRPLGYRITTYDGQALPTGDVRYHALLVPSGKVIPATTA